MTDEETITHRIAEIAATADLYPGVIILLNIRTGSVEYMSQLGLMLLSTSTAELRAMGPAYHSRFFSQAESEEYGPKVWSMLAQNDTSLVVSFFQQVRASPTADWGLYFSTARLLARGQDGLPLLIISSAHPVEPASHVAIKVQRLLDENNFLRRNAATFAGLTARERLVLRELALGKSAQEIASTMVISVQTAETHRRNIRRKLRVSSVFELGQYARAFDLI